MKVLFSASTFGLAIALIVSAPQSHAQQPSPAGGGSWADLYGHSAPCVSPEQQAELVPMLRERANAIMAGGAFGAEPLRRGIGHVQFSSPIRHKDEFDDPGYYAVINFVDHDLTFNNLSDYNCGERTYDWFSGNHQGTDYILWPYPWKRMDEDVMEIIAAAPGVIIHKVDGNYDRNCALSGSTSWNSIYVLHADSSIAWYLHFKTGSLTSKGIGQSVVKGEFLGTAGSSGSSTIPHLHFQVFDSNDEVIDPYTGTCNSMNPDTWWEEQPDYWEPQMNRISTHFKPPQEMCPLPETTNEALSYEPGDTVWIAVWYKDLLNAASTLLKIERPDGSLMIDWNFISPWPNYSAAYTYWAVETSVTDEEGPYIYRVNFNGEQYERVFYLGEPPVEPTGLEALDTHSGEWQLYPNPASGPVTLQWEQAQTEQAEIVVRDMQGRLMHQQQVAGDSAGMSVQLPEFPAGVYQVQVLSDRRSSARLLMIGK